MSTVSGYSERYFFLNYKQLWYFSSYKIIYAYIFFFLQKSQLYRKADGRKEKPAVSLPAADKKCYHFTRDCFPALQAVANELYLQPTSFLS